MPLSCNFFPQQTLSGTLQFLLFVNFQKYLVYHNITSMDYFAESQTHTANACKINIPWTAIYRKEWNSSSQCGTGDNGTEYGTGKVSLLPPANEICEGYVFTRVCLSVCPQVGRYAPQVGTPASRYSPHPQATVHAGIRSTNGRYASHWNAFLF